MAAWTVALAAPGAVSAQGRVVRARMVADLTGAEGLARVSLEYRLTGVRPEDEVPVSLLALGGADVAEVWVGGRRVPLPVTRKSFREAVLSAAPGDAPAPPAGDVPMETRLRVSYSVSNPVRGTRTLRVHLPVVSVAWPPEEALPATFSVEVRVPPGWRVTESFPTGLAPSPGESILTGDLPVVPSVVILRVRVGPGGGVGLPLVLDLLAGTFLVGFSVVGWSYLRRAAT